MGEGLLREERVSEWGEGLLREERREGLLREERVIEERDYCETRAESKSGAGVLCDERCDR